MKLTDRQPDALPAHVPLVAQTRGNLIESVHYGSLVATNADGTVLLQAGDPDALIYPRSALKPLQAVALVRAGLVLPTEGLALAAASHSGAARHLDVALATLASAGLDESALANTPDLPYGVVEREQWLRAGRGSTHLAQNCSGKHAAMLATCALNGWPVRGYLDPAHPLPTLIRSVVEELTGERITSTNTSTDGCGTEVFGLSLRGMATAFSRIIGAAPGTAESSVAVAMRAFPELVAGEGRDVTALMRAVPGLLAKDGFEGVQLVALPTGVALAIKIADGGDRARLPITVAALKAVGVDPRLLAGLPETAVLGGGRLVGRLEPLLQFPDFQGAA